MSKLTVELWAPPAITLGLWAASHILPRFQREKTKPMNGAQFWLLLIAAYFTFAVALWGADWLATHEREDPSFQMVQ